VLQDLCTEAKVALEHVAYISDDVNDVAALQLVGMPIAVRDALPDVMAIVRHVTTAPGGNGAVREVCDLILRARGLDPVKLWNEAHAE